MMISPIVTHFLPSLISIRPDLKLISYREQVLDLSNYPLSIRLFSAFAEVGSSVIFRDELIKRVYGIDQNACSERLKRSLRHNLVKLISRARQLISEHFDQHANALRWFVFDRSTQRYFLVQAAPVASSFESREEFGRLIASN
jgi:hypothetical protein